MSDSWGADVPISMPEPLKSRPLVDMVGFAFTEDGIVHPLTEEQRAEIAHPTYAPKQT